MNWTNSIMGLVLTIFLLMPIVDATTLSESKKIDFVKGDTIKVSGMVFTPTTSTTTTTINEILEEPPLSYQRMIWLKPESFGFEYFKSLWIVDSCHYIYDMDLDKWLKVR